ncbi:phosphatidyl inositol kinase, partial [Cladochytrium tenue]
MAAVVAATESTVDAVDADAPAHHHIAPEFFDHIVGGPGFAPVDDGGDSDDDHPEQEGDDYHQAGVGGSCAVHDDPAHQPLLPPSPTAPPPASTSTRTAAAFDYLRSTWLSASSYLRAAVGLTPPATDCSCGRDSGGSHDDSTRTRSWIRHRSGDARRLPRQPLPLDPSISPSLLPDDVSPLEPAFPTEPFPTQPLLDGAIIPYVTLQLPAGYVNPVRPVTPVNARHFLDIVEDVRRAISLGVYPTRIAKGSSGSYFCRNTAGAIVGVFKPRDEEPYARLNPKWTKWLHRTCLPCCFGRSCLVPNTGYLSEAGASYLDRRLGLNVVPRTEVVALASPTFFYKRRDRRRYARGVPLPPKLGSFQLFLSDFKDATTFLRDGYEQLVQHQARAPSPAVSVASPTDRPDDENPTFGRSSPAFSVSSRSSTGLLSTLSSAFLSPPPPPEPAWTDQARLDFQLGFERLVILDYLIRNTDRGLDNWMVCYRSAASSSAAATAAATEADTARRTPAGGRPLAARPSMLKLRTPSARPASPLAAASPTRLVAPGSPATPVVSTKAGAAAAAAAAAEPAAERPRPSALTSDLVSTAATPATAVVDVAPPPPATVPPPAGDAAIVIAAIDNGLAFPFKHPDRLRSYPYGWAQLPIARVPFSQSTRAHALHFLTSDAWWLDTLAGLERIYRLDPTFSRRDWRRQRAVLRGQGFNLVAELLDATHPHPHLPPAAAPDVATSLEPAVSVPVPPIAPSGSPLALSRRSAVSVFEDFVVGAAADPDGDAAGGGGRQRTRVVQRTFVGQAARPYFSS